MSLFLFKLQRWKIFYPAIRQQKLDGTVCEPTTKKTCICALTEVNMWTSLIGGKCVWFRVATGAKPETHTHTDTHLQTQTPQNNGWTTCSPGGFVTASAWAAHCYGAISLMGLVSVRQRAKIIIFQGLNFITWQRFHRQEGTVATTYYHDMWVEADAAGDIVDFNANQTPIRAQLSSS